MSAQSARRDAALSIGINPIFNEGGCSRLFYFVGVGAASEASTSLAAASFRAASLLAAASFKAAASLSAAALTSTAFCRASASMSAWAGVDCLWQAARPVARSKMSKRVGEFMVEHPCGWNESQARVSRPWEDLAGAKKNTHRAHALAVAKKTRRASCLKTSSPPQALELPDRGAFARCQARS